MEESKEKIAKLIDRQTRILDTGGSQQAMKQHEKGKLTARERIDLFLMRARFMK